MVVKTMLVIVFVIPIICLCGLFVYEAEKMQKMQNAEVQNDR